MPEPELRDDSLTVEIDGATFIFRGIQCRARQFDAELEVHRPVPLDPLEAAVWNPGLPAFRFHISTHSLSNITNFRRAIDSYYGKDLPWEQMIIRACKEAEAIYRAASFVEWPEHAGNLQAISYAVEGMFPEYQVSCLFGMPEAVKSLALQSICHAVSMGWPWLGLPTRQQNVLWLDYENPRVDTFAFRRRRLTMGGHESYPGAIGWMNARGVPLCDQIDAIQREMERMHATMLVVDSLALAAGGDAIEQRVANDFYNAVHKLRCTVVAIAHTNKAEDDRMPFGSVFWNAGLHGRSWFLKRGEDTEDTRTVGFYGRKVSDGRRLADFGVRFAFEGEDGPITLAAVDIAEINRQTGRTSARERIMGVLMAEGKLAAREIAALTQVPHDQVRSRLSAMAKAGEVAKDAEGSWYAVYNE